MCVSKDKRERLGVTELFFVQPDAIRNSLLGTDVPSVDPVYNSVLESFEMTEKVK